ncbi:GMC family oxidoreductase N-terminal domain-containing protein [Saccharopolyspora sp. HNM0983]|uniref:GMC family oxidoreductase N-terminal domain-containing protein n=1 Tax=Saccharopolyspora montiporae TaxID=2781240 RepID=A0A929B5Z0_9PSEU|nr:GMC family oxidoreductase N-terminal domain-containing protein [Saccharopolyspora sp. HNM0983]MBE9373817.1 GMC family oxidoreductase N-terminal domain-containing protein [Saccharopolyspora sp. HNM0983]
MSQADYVVVGAGSAGCAVARRLADSGASVVLVEAGGRDDRGPLKSLLRIPGAIAAMLSTPELKKNFDWGYKSVPQTDAWQRVVPQTRGRVLGGSSSINGMLFVRGNRQNYDDWASDGCKGWSFDDVLPAFKRLEDWEGGASELRGSGGPIRVRRVNTMTDAASDFMDAATSRLGVPRVEDYNGESQEGISAFQLSADRGVRYSSSKGYLHDDRPNNLVVLTDATVTKVVFRGSRATGIEVADKKGTKHTVHAGSEVVLSAGAFGSPQILMLSGVGPAEHLRGHGIEPRADLPVGDNLHDHLFVPISFRMDSALRKPTPAYFAGGLLREMIRPGRGWAAGSQFEASGFVRTSYAGSVPDLQLLSLYWVYPVPNQDSDKGLRPPTTKPGQSVFPTLIYPESRGTVRLKSADPLAAPLIDPAYLKAQQDTEVLLEGVRMVRETMAGVGDSQGEIGPGEEYRDEREMRRVLPNFVHSVYHPVGTCRMGSDERAVVGPDLKVRGVDGLRVADASVIPSITGGNTNAPAIMIGERCAEEILR